MSSDLTRPRNPRVMWLYRQETIKKSYHPAKFGGHRHCGGDMFLVCHVILVFIGLIEMEISIRISILTWITWKKLNSRFRSDARFLRSEILIYNSDIPHTAGRKKRRRTQATAKRFAFYANTIKHTMTNTKPYLVLHTKYVRIQDNTWIKNLV